MSAARRCLAPNRTRRQMNIFRMSKFSPVRLRFLTLAIVPCLFRLSPPSVHGGNLRDTSFNARFGCDFAPTGRKVQWFACDLQVVFV
jgi:hypothetical protein